ncbi:hypothetical protein ACP4OV_017125 [Aristida adscensionis]
MTRAAPRRRWSAKQYVVAALLGGLVVAGVIAAISIALAPGHVAFSISSARMDLVELKTTEQNRRGWYYNFTIAAINTSRRMAVWYDSLSAEVWPSNEAWIPADADMTAGRWRRPGDSDKFAVLAESWQFDRKTDNQTQEDIMKDSSDCKVVVTAKVHFGFGMVPSMAYDLVATCQHVNFFPGGTNFPVHCTASG